jgi:hypothetical protein
MTTVPGAYSIAFGSAFFHYRVKLEHFLLNIRVVRVAERAFGLI